MAIDFVLNIDVDDLELGVAFYVDGLGLEMGRRLGDGAVELLGGPAPIFLLLQAAGTVPYRGATAPRGYARHWTPVHLDFVVADLDLALARAIAAGARHEGELANLVWGRLATLSDPWGNGFCLIEFTGRGYDEIAVQG
jgi:lactoylglutathione lyase